MGNLFGAYGYLVESEEFEALEYLTSVRNLRALLLQLDLNSLETVQYQ